MSAYNLVQKFCADKVNVQLGKSLGSGFHGEVFEVAGSPDKVIKFSYVSEDMCSSRGTLDYFYRNVEEVQEEQLRHGYSCFALIESFELLYTGKVPWHPATRRPGMQNFILYSTVMEKLFPMTADENKLFGTICNAVCHSRQSTLGSLVKEQAGWLDFSLEKVMSFLNELNCSPIVQTDFTRFNIMKDLNGNFKIIDFDFAEFKENNYESCRFECIEQAC